MDKRQVLREVIPRLLRWYSQNGRLLPWREDRDPYRVWVSEIMLQQTRIEAVIGYYLRFMRRLPDVYALAAVPEDELLKLWEGLGYYSRARNLKRAAVTIVDEYGGKLPADFAALRKLAGIGDYTAGAIASVAFGLPEPAVDGNVQRVAARLFADGSDIADPKTRKSLEAELRAVYPQGEDASALTQALMELGEVVCLPNGAPLCASCPVSDLCAAHAQGREQDFPVKSPKKARKKQQKTIFLLCADGKYALRKRGGSGLLASMWEFPACEGSLRAEEAAARLAEWGVQTEKLEFCGNSSHIFTHVEWDMLWVRVRCAAPVDEFTWASAEEIARRYAVPSAFRYYKKLI